MAQEYAQIRRVLLDIIRRMPEWDFNLAPSDGGIRREYDQKGCHLDDNDLFLLQQIVHELYVEKIIIPGDKTQRIGGFHWEWPKYRLTEYGRNVLEHTEYQPYDPDGYLKRLQQEVQNIHSDVIRYLEEGLSCFRANYLLSASVMLGCAAEKAMLELIEAFRDWIQDDAEKRQFEKKIQNRFIKTQYNELWKKLEPLSSSMAPDLKDDLHTILDRVFDLIRTARNEAGHPTGKRIKREAVHANFLLFPGYCCRVYSLITHFQSNKI